MSRHCKCSGPEPYCHCLRLLQAHAYFPLSSHPALSPSLHGSFASHRKRRPQPPPLAPTAHLTRPNRKSAYAISDGGASGTDASAEDVEIGGGAVYPGSPQQATWLQQGGDGDDHSDIAPGGCCQRWCALKCCSRKPDVKGEDRGRSEGGTPDPGLQYWPPPVVADRTSAADKVASVTFSRSFWARFQLLWVLAKVVAACVLLLQLIAAPLCVYYITYKDLECPDLIRLY